MALDARVLPKKNTVLATVYVVVRMATDGSPCRPVYTYE
jgi:hypothetical protein